MQQVTKHIKQPLNIALLMAIGLLFANMAASAQVKHQANRNQVAASEQLRNFKNFADEAGVVFTIPEGFKEIKAINNENLSFDYAMIIPGQEFEVWFQIKSLKQNWASYERAQSSGGKQLANPDSLYLDVSRAHVRQLSSDDKFFTRNLTNRALEVYNADAGKTYLINLIDSPETKHYKYALLIALQKHHVGMVMAVCLTNEKGPEFFKKINQARNCIKFK